MGGDPLSEGGGRGPEPPSPQSEGCRVSYPHPGLDEKEKGWGGGSGTLLSAHSTHCLLFLFNTHLGGKKQEFSPAGALGTCW